MENVIVIVERINLTPERCSLFRYIPNMCYSKQNSCALKEPRSLNKNSDLRCKIVDPRYFEGIPENIQLVFTKTLILRGSMLF